MRCPFCAIQDTRVIDSRLANEGDQVRRRRECATCKERFTTFENVELNLPHIVKNDGSCVLFNETKLRTGMLKALEKRPVDSDKIEQAITRINKHFMSLGEREVSTRAVGEQVMQELSGLDHVAYVRFASVYCSFENVSEFTKVIEKLQSK